MNPEIIRNFSQSISKTHVGGIDTCISTSLPLLSGEYLHQARPAYIPPGTRNFLDLPFILQKTIEFFHKSHFSQQDLPLNLTIAPCYLPSLERSQCGSEEQPEPFYCFADVGPALLGHHLGQGELFEEFD